jgi:hypothetical protein
MIERRLNSMDMLKTDKNIELSKNQPAPQFQVRSGITAGASVESCLEDLYYWQNQYYHKCGGQKPTLYTQ